MAFQALRSNALVRPAGVALVLVLVLMAGVVSGHDTAAADVSTEPLEQIHSLPRQGPASPEQALAERFAPIIYLKTQSQACGEGEGFVPMDVDLLFGKQQIVLVGADGSVLTGPTGADMYGKGAGNYLDYPGDPRSAGCGYEQSFRELGGGQEAVVYAHIAGEEGYTGLALQYWYFYYFNDWNNRHEGDWEMIQLVFAESTVEEALQSVPVEAIYSQHGTQEKHDWDSSTLSRDGDHPVTYPSSGSHATYFEPAIYIGRGEGGTGFGCDDASAPSTRWNPRVVTLPDSVSSADNEFAWLGFEGRWGQQLRSELNGPTGPNMKTAWQTPLSWAEQVERTSNLTVPETVGFGVSASDLFCWVIEKGSALLFDLSNNWALAAVLVLAVIALAGVTVVAGVKEVGSVFRARGRGWVLIEERSFGNIVVAAAKVFFLHSRMWMLLTLSIMPIGFVLTAIAAFFIAHPPLETLLQLADDRALEVAFVVLYGIGSSLELLWLSTLICSAAMRQIRDGEKPGFVATWKEALHYAGPALVARLRALLIVVLLVITIVGMPWAMWRIVQWYLIEEQIVLEGASRRDAPRASAALVRGQWWRTFGITLVLGLLATVFVPFIGALFFLFSDVPLWTLDLVCSLSALLALPLVGIALVFLHWDLKSRAGAASSVDVRHSD